MVEFLPFEGIRPNLKAGEHIADRISPPYDVISPEELEALKAKHCNITRLTLCPDADKRYHGSRKELDQWIADDELKQDPPSFYIYEQNFDDHGVSRTRTGIVGILRTEKYEAGNIIPHEETFSKVKADRLNLLRDMEAHLESIFGIFDGFTPELTKTIRDNARLVYRHVDDTGVEHKYYRISDPGICKAVSDELKEQKMLIADGHHRYETALNYALENPDDAKKQYVLATLVPSNDEGLVIWPTHRMIKSGNISEKNAVKSVEKALKTKEVSREEMIEKLPEHLMGMIFRSGKCILIDCDDTSNEMFALDTYAAQQKILYGIYKSDEGKAEVSYDAELPDVLSKMDNGGFDAAIVLNPPKLQTIWDLSMKGKRMPKKTTFFFPKVWSGFVIYRMD